MAVLVITTSLSITWLWHEQKINISVAVRLAVWWSLHSALHSRSIERYSKPEPWALAAAKPSRPDALLAAIHQPRSTKTVSNLVSNQKQKFNEFNARLTLNRASHSRENFMLRLKTYVRARQRIQPNVIILGISSTAGKILENEKWVVCWNRKLRKASRYKESQSMNGAQRAWN